MAFEHISQALDARQKLGLLRRPVAVENLKGTSIRVSGECYVNFSGNDYLGMSRHPKVISAYAELPCAGAGASPVVTGFSTQHEALCDYLKHLTGQEAVMLFNSGFAANHAICQTLFSEKKGLTENNSLIVADKLSHASIIDGALSSNALFKRFAHNDVQHLCRILKANHSNEPQDVLVISEGVFSMDGDSAPLGDLLITCRENNAWLMLDNAHVIGCKPASEIFQFQLAGESVKPQIVMATFGKAIGTGGAFVAASKDVINYLQNFARHYVYSTAFSPAHALATLTSLQLIEQESWRTDKLNDNIRYFKKCCNEMGLALTDSDSAIQPIIIGDPQIALTISEALKEHGFWGSAIRYPTVPKHTDRLRITLSCEHEHLQILTLIRTLNSALANLNEVGRKI